MVKGLYTAYTGMLNQQNRMDVLTNNLANSATVGFKKEGSLSLGAKVGENYTDFTQGAFQTTENPFDLALSGNGFFACEYTNKAGVTSVKYTRDGSFILNQSGDLVTKDGDYVLDANGRHIRLNPQQETVFNENGTITQNGVTVAALQIADFTDYNYLEHFGESYYQPVEGATRKQADAKVFSGYLEQSNVTVINEMVELISVTRNYETNQKVIQTIDGTLDIAANQLGQLR